VIRVEAVDYLLERFGLALDREAAFKAEGFVKAKIKARLEKAAAKEPEFAHLLAEVAEHVLSSFGGLMASPDAASAAMKAAEEVGERLPVEDLFSYMAGWDASDVAITRNKKGERALRMTTSHLWQLSETHALFDWSVVGPRMSLTLEGPKLQVVVEAPLDKLDEAIKKSAEDGWLKTLGIKAESWDGLKQRVVENWGLVVDAAVSRLREVLKEEELRRLLAPKGRDAPEGRKGGQEAPRDKHKDGINVWEELRRRLNALGDMLDVDNIAREVVAPALLLIQAEKLGVDEATLRYFGAVISGAIGGDGYVSAAMGVVGLTCGKLEAALL
jgi:hypothetical protein